MPTFPNYSPDMDSAYDKKPLLLHASFGDGYYQTAGDGIRPYEDKWSMSFSARPLTVVTAIKDFLDALNGASFDWQSPLSAAPTKWKYLEGYNVSKQGPDAYKIEFEIVGVTL